MHPGLVIASAVLLGLAIAALSIGLDHLSERRGDLVRSAAGGLTIAFVMLGLFVELAEGSSHGLHEIVRAGPEPVHTVAMLLLAGTLGTFLAAALAARFGRARAAHAIALTPHLAYCALIGAGLVGEAAGGPLSLGLYWIAMAVHVAVLDHQFVRRFPKGHGPRSTALTSAALVLGAIVWVWAEPPAAVFHLILALVAGTTLILVLQDDLPAPKDARIGAIAFGAAVFTLLQQLRWRV